MRKAIPLAYDAMWYAGFLGGVFGLPGSFYGRSRLAARGCAGYAKAAVLARFAETLPENFLDSFPGTSEGHLATERDRLALADQLLEGAGFLTSDGRRVHAQTNELLTLSLLTEDRVFANQMLSFQSSLERLVIRLDVLSAVVATLQCMIADHGFDFVRIPWQANDPPGHAEYSLWHCSDATGRGYGFAGLNSPVADAMIEAMQTSTDEQSTGAATRVFDRYMRWSYNAMPLWEENQEWYVYRRGLSFPDRVDARRPLAEYWFWTK